jgi:RNA polymerase sigma-70 factor, ECF subfamily
VSLFTAVRVRTPDGVAKFDSAATVGPDLEVEDSVLLNRVGHDREALARLFERYFRLVRAISARILGDTGEAEDLVQDVFLFLQRKCSVFDRTKSSARSWIVQMTYQRAIERRRYLSVRQFYRGADDQTAVERLVGTPTDEMDYSAEAVFGRNG